MHIIYTRTLTHTRGLSPETNPPQFNVGLCLAIYYIVRTRGMTAIIYIPLAQAHLSKFGGYLKNILSFYGLQI